MTIKTSQTGFTTAELNTDTYAHMNAKLDGCRSFYVSMKEECYDGWNFNENSCLEAAEFFTKLADELRRRRDEDLTIYSSNEVPF